MYFLKCDDLMAVRFDSRARRFGAPFRVKLWPGPQSALTSFDFGWYVGSRGIVFSRGETQGSVWLMEN